MEKKPNTKKGEDVAVFLTDNVVVVFEKVNVEGDTTVDKPTKVLEPAPGKVVQYYDIKTGAKYQPYKITIRINLPCVQYDERPLRLMQFFPHELAEKWKDITKHFNAKYNLIIGETDELSIFGVTRG